ncbi:MAG: heliorhodopsin HeR [Solirubrobacterales bacterium]
MSSSSIPAGESRRLTIWNASVGVLHLVQATLILVIANDASLPIYASWVDGPPATAVPILGEPIIDLPIGLAVAAFLYLAAADHLIVASPFARPWYERNLARGINYARWWEYSISASLMVVLIAMLAGTRELTALVAIFGASAAMILFGLLMERGSRPGRDADLWPFWLGTAVGLVPWIAIGIQLVRAQAEAAVPGFVFAIFVSLLLLFALFPINMYLQYKRIGPWRDYLYGERAYILLSLTAKSALAWQVFGGALAG